MLSGVRGVEASIGRCQSTLSRIAGCSGGEILRLRQPSLRMTNQESRGWISRAALRSRPIQNPCISDWSAQYEAGLRRGRPMHPGPQEAVGERGSPRIGGASEATADARIRDYIRFGDSFRRRGCSDRQKECRTPDARRAGDRLAAGSGQEARYCERSHGNGERQDYEHGHLRHAVAHRRPHFGRTLRERSPRALDITPTYSSN